MYLELCGSSPPLCKGVRRRGDRALLPAAGEDDSMQSGASVMWNASGAKRIRGEPVPSNACSAPRFRLLRGDGHRLRSTVLLEHSDGCQQVGNS